MKTHHSNQWWEAVLTESFRKHTFFQSWRGPMWDPFLQLGISYNVSMLCGEYHFSNWRSSCFVVKVHLANKKGTGTWEFWVTSPITDVKMRIHPRKLWWNLKKGPLDKEFSIYIHQFVGSILIDSGVYSISNFEPPPNFCIYIYTYHTSMTLWLVCNHNLKSEVWKTLLQDVCFLQGYVCIYIYIHICFFLVHVNLFGQNKIKHTSDHGEICEVSQLCSQYAQCVKMDTVWGLPKPWKLQDFHCERMFFWSKIQLWDLMTYVSHHVT